MADGKARGRFVWYDLMTDDLEAAREFYTAVTGWGVTRWEGGSEPYSMWTVDDRPLGGMMRLPEEARKEGRPAHWLAYVGTPDVDATAARAGELGGRLRMPPTEIPEIGTFAVLTDPQGATFAAFTAAAEAPGHDGPPRVREFSWHELATTDLAAAFEFYADLFGWRRLEAMDMGEMGIYQMFGRDEMPLGGMFDKPEEVPAPPHWLHYVRMDDLDAAVERVIDGGGSVVNGPMEVPGGDRVAQCMDPQGAAVALHEQAGGS